MEAAVDCQYGIGAGIRREAIGKAAPTISPEHIVTISDIVRKQVCIGQKNKILARCEESNLKIFNLSPTTLTEIHNSTWHISYS